MSKCTKPNCDCLERAEKANGGPLKDGYPCLYNTDAINAAKEKYRPSPSLPETEQGTKTITFVPPNTPSNFGSQFPDQPAGKVDHALSLRRGFIMDSNSVPIQADQPVPEEEICWAEWSLSDAIDAFKKRLAEIKDLQSRLSSTEAERDAIRQAFDLQAEELRKYRNQ